MRRGLPCVDGRFCRSLLHWGHSKCGRVYAYSNRLVLGDFVGRDSGEAKMTKILILLALLTPDRPLYDAIRMVESGGDDRAIGDSGRSRGPYQCGRAAWQDACEYGKVKWDYDTFVWSRWHCERIMGFYWARYKAETWEEKARCWNSGPRWRKKYHLTNGYWREVQQHLKGR